MLILRLTWSDIIYRNLDVNSIFVAIRSGSNTYIFTFNSFLFYQKFFGPVVKFY